MKFYIDEKQRQKRRRNLKMKIYGGIAVFFVLLVGAIYLIAYSPLFQIERIDAAQSGSEDVPLKTEDIVQSLKDFFESKSQIASFLGTENILIWKETGADFLLKYPQLEKIEVEKKYSKRLLKINLVKKEKKGVWCVSSGCFWFDGKGALFAEAPMIEGGLILTINDFSGRELKIGDLVLPENFLGNFFKIIGFLEKNGLAAKNLKLNDLSFQEITAESGGGPQIRFSLRNDPVFAESAIQSLKEIGLRNIEYIDLRVENKAYYKLK